MPREGGMRASRMIVHKARCMLSAATWHGGSSPWLIPPTISAGKTTASRPFPTRTTSRCGQPQFRAPRRRRMKVQITHVPLSPLKLSWSRAISWPMPLSCPSVPPVFDLDPDPLVERITRRVCDHMNSAPLDETALSSCDRREGISFAIA